MHCCGIDGTSQEKQAGSVFSSGSGARASRSSNGVNCSKRYSVKISGSCLEGKLGTTFAVSCLLNGWLLELQLPYISSLLYI
jgi:hypothetical protein